MCMTRIGSAAPTSRAVLAVYSVQVAILALLWTDCQKIVSDRVNGQHRSRSAPRKAIGLGVWVSATSPACVRLARKSPTAIPTDSAT